MSEDGMTEIMLEGDPDKGEFRVNGVNVMPLYEAIDAFAEKDGMKPIIMFAALANRLAQAAAEQDMSSSDKEKMLDAVLIMVKGSYHGHIEAVRGLASQVRH